MYTISQILIFISILIGIISIGLISKRIYIQETEKNGQGTDLIKNKKIYKFLQSKYFPLIIQIPTLFFFISLITLGFFQENEGSKSLATVFIWDIWWVLIIFSFVLLGRIWCQVCPFSYIGDLVKKIYCFKKTFPSFLQNRWLQIVLFLFLTWSFSYLALSGHPILTSIITLAVFVLPMIILSLIYDRKVYCKYICPLGSLTGLYSMVSWFGLRSRDKDFCNKTCTSKDCVKSCPMGLYMGAIDRNTECLLCTKCIKACPHKNIGLFTKCPLKDISQTKTRFFDESTIVLLIYGITLEESAAMLTMWPEFQNFLSNLLGINNLTLIFLISLFLLTALPLLLFLLINKTYKFFNKTKEISLKSIVKIFGYTFIPLSLSLHLSHNLQHFLGEGKLIIPSLKNFLNSNGFNFKNINFEETEIISDPHIIIYIQNTILLIGFILSMYLIYKVTKKEFTDKNTALKIVMPLIVIMIIFMTINIAVLGLPMDTH